MLRDSLATDYTCFVTFTRPDARRASWGRRRSLYELTPLDRSNLDQGATLVSVAVTHQPVRTGIIDIPKEGKQLGAIRHYAQATSNLVNMISYLLDVPYMPQMLQFTI